MISTTLVGVVGFIAGAASMFCVILTLELVLRQLCKMFGSVPREKHNGPSILGKAAGHLAAAWRAVRGLAVARIGRLRKWILRRSR